MKKILFINNSMNIGGIENFLMNIIRNIDRSKYQIDFLCYRNEEFYYEREILNLGCKIYKISNPDVVSIYKHISEIEKILKENNYDVVHSNTYFDSAYVCYIAKKNNINIRITHSHTGEGCYPKNLVQFLKWKIARLLINRYSNYKLACSEEAGKGLYGKSNYLLLENGVDITRFKFNVDIRKKIRNNYKLDEKNILIGHIGRFSKVKNHKYIIEIFEKLVKEDDKYRLLLVGDGPEYKKVNDLVRDRNIKDKVFFAGAQSDTSSFYNAIDVMLYPSIYEGLPMTFVEAQVNGLSILASDTISKDSNLCESVQFLSLNEDVNVWVNELKSIDLTRKDNTDFFINSNFNIKNTIKKLCDIYEEN